MKLTKEDLQNLITKQNEVILSRNATFQERKKAYALKEEYKKMLKNFN